MDERINIENNLSASEWEFLNKEFSRVGVLIEELISVRPNSLLIKARQNNLERHSVVKVLSAGVLSTDVAFLRFQEEAKLLGTFSHPKIVQLYGTGRLSDGRAYMIMEYLQGKTLEQVIQSGELDDEQTVRDYAADICEALAFAHQHKVIHRDVKPSNVMICDTEDGGRIAKLIDFGIFKKTESPDGGMHLTQEGSLLGTANFMSPEQCSGLALDERTDIYSFGCVLYNMVAGKPPMDAETDLLIMSNQLKKEIAEVPAKFSVSRSLKTIVLKCLAKEREKRFQSASGVLAALKAPASGFDYSPSKKAMGYALGVLIAITLIGCGALYYRVAKGTDEASPRTMDYLYEDRELGILSRGWESFWHRVLELDFPLHEIAFKRWTLDHVKNPETSYIEFAKGAQYDGLALDCVPPALLKPFLARVNERLGVLANSKKLVYFQFKPVEASPEELVALYYLKFTAAMKLNNLAEAESAAEAFYSHLSSLKLRKNEYNRYAQELLLKCKNTKPSECAAMFSRLKSTIPNGEEKLRVTLFYSELIGPPGWLPALTEALNITMSLGDISDRGLLVQLVDRLRNAGDAAETFKIMKKFPLRPADRDSLAFCYFHAFVDCGDASGAANALNFLYHSNTFKSNPENVETLLAFELQLDSLTGKEKEATILAKKIFSTYGTKSFENVNVRLAVESGSATNDEILHLLDVNFPNEYRSLAIYHAARGHILRTRSDYVKALAQYKLAHSYFEKTKEFFHGRRNVYIGETNAYMGLHDFPKAKSALEKAIAYGDENAMPDKYGLQSTKATLLRAENKIAEAIELHNKIVNSFTESEKKLYHTTYTGIVGELCSDYFAANDKAAVKSLIAQQSPILESMGEHGKYVANYMKALLSQMK